MEREKLSFERGTPIKHYNQLWSFKSLVFQTIDERLGKQTLFRNTFTKSDVNEIGNLFYWLNSPEDFPITVGRAFSQTA